MQHFYVQRRCLSRPCCLVTFLHILDQPSLTLRCLRHLMDRTNSETLIWACAAERTQQRPRRAPPDHTIYLIDSVGGAHFTTQKTRSEMHGWNLNVESFVCSRNFHGCVVLQLSTYQPIILLFLALLSLAIPKIEAKCLTSLQIWLYLFVRLQLCTILQCAVLAVISFDAL